MTPTFSLQHEYLNITLEIEDLIEERKCSMEEQMEYDETSHFLRLKRLRAERHKIGTKLDKRWKDSGLAADMYQ